jgi:4-hydroxybenzoate polyprenyltransferase
MIRCLNILLYSNIYIALCAVAMTLQTCLLLQLQLRPLIPLLVLIFCATLIIYALHRLVSLTKVQAVKVGTRFWLIASYKGFLRFLIVASSFVCSVCLLFLNYGVQVVLIPATIISIAYVFPFIGQQKRRLRDYNYLKIFLIALIWSLVTVALPILESQSSFAAQEFGMVSERFLFIFIITLPFDIRDLDIDRRNAVQTIPALIGQKATFYLGLSCLIFWVFIVYLLYPFVVFLPLLLTAFVTLFFIKYASQQQHDYFFTAGVDGLMLLQFILIYGCMFF